MYNIFKRIPIYCWIICIISIICITISVNTSVYYKHECENFIEINNKLNNDITQQDITINDLKIKLIEKNKEIERLEAIISKYDLESIRVKTTAYCKENYPHICNNGDSSTTSTGAIPTVGRTVAVDPSLIPYGSRVIIDGHTYIAEDCGGGIKGNRVDILFNTHKEALEWGIKYKDIQVIK